MAGLRKRFGEQLALDGVELRVSPGQLVGFLGPNGAGKTTTMRAILRLVSVDGGSITWDGQPVGEEQRRRIGYMPQERGLYTRMAVHEHVAYIGRLAGLAAADADAAARYWVARVGLADRSDDLIDSLSGGSQQRVQLAVALVNDPALLVLDEPFAGLDPLAARMLRHILAEHAADGAAIVFSSHRLDQVQDLCDDVTIISRGATVAAGAVEELRRRPARRVVEIRWDDPSARWTPSSGLLAHDAAGAIGEVRSGPGWIRFTVPATVDPACLAESAAGAGTVSSFSIAPVPLEEVFVDLVAAERADGG